MKFVPNVPTNYIPPMVQIIAWPKQMTSHYLNRLWHSSLTHMCVTRPQSLEAEVRQCYVHSALDRASNWRWCLQMPWPQQKRQVNNNHYAHSYLTSDQNSVTEVYVLLLDHQWRPDNRWWNEQFDDAVQEKCTHVTDFAPVGEPIMMTSSNGKIFHVTGHLRGEFTGHRWIPRTKASDAELWCFHWSAPD